MPRQDSPMEGFQTDDVCMRRWQHLTAVAFRLGERVDELQADSNPDSCEGETRAGQEQVLLAIDDILEVFPKDLDPVDDLPAYAVRRLAKTLKRALGG